MKTKIYNLENRTGFVIFLVMSMILTPAILTANDQITVISQDNYGMILEFTLPPFEIENISGPDSSYQKIRINGWGMTSETGFPELPLTGILIQTPLHGATDVHILEDNYESLPNMNIYPVPRLKISDNGKTSYEFEKNSNVYSTSEFYPETLAEAGNQGILRGSHVVRLKICPFRWNPGTLELRCSKKIRIRIKFETPLEPKIENRKSKIENHYDPFENLKQEAIINYNRYSKPETRNLKLETRRRRQSETSLKLEIKQDGIYRLTYDDLSDAGLDPGSIDPATFRIFNLGKEAAIKVESQGDTFSSGDYIEFFGKGIDNHITGTNVYWMHWGESPGKRMETTDGKVTGQGDKQESFRDTLHIEENKGWSTRTPGAPEKDFWFWKVLAVQSADQIVSEHSITIPSPGSSQTGAEVSICFQGKTDSNHTTSVYLNDAEIGTSNWSGLSEHIQTMPGSQNLSETNTVRIKMDVNGQAYLNWIEIHYNRLFEAAEDQLIFTVEGNDILQMEITGLTHQDVSIYDITDHDNVGEVSNFSVQFGKAAFEDMVNGTKTFYVLCRDQIIKPDIKLWNSANLKDPTNGADYIIITASEFLPSVEPLRQFRENQELRAMSVSTEEIFSEFSYGLFAPEAIRDFLKYAYENWEKPAPMYMFCVGDAHQDYRDYTGTGKENKVPVHLSVTSDIGLTPDDNWYTYVHGNDIYPDMMLGRITGATPDAVAATIDKIIAYEDNNDYKPARVLLAADNGEQDYENANEDLIKYIPPDFSIDKVYLNAYGNVDDATQDIIAGIDKGVLITNFVGHGNIPNWAGEYLFISSDPDNSSVPSDIESLSNKDKLTFVLSMNCLSGYFAQPYFYSLAEEFVSAHDKGAIACFAPTGYTTPIELGDLNSIIFSTIFEQENIVGAAVMQSKIAAYMSWGSVDLMTVFNLTGDPATKLKYDPPVKPQAETQPVSNITATTATGNGNITDSGTDNPTHHGFAWSTEHEPDIELTTKTDSGTVSDTGPFTGLITGLTPGTTYFIRAYATNTAGTGYGEEIEFKTLAPLPEVETLTVDDITSVAATFNGNISVMDPEPEQHGFAWSTEHEPTIDLSTKTESGTVSATGPFSDSITGLTPETTYYIRAYVSDAQETYYGEEVEFRTLAKQPELPTVETDSVTSLTATTATGKGNITDLGYPEPTHHGIVWSREHKPTISLNTKTDSGPTSSAGLFTGSITNLNPDTTYYARAYATNTAGTAYGDEVEFRTLPAPSELPTVKTEPVSSITATTAKGKGDITDLGYPEPTHHGIVWSREHNPSVSLSTKTDSGSVSSEGLFIGSITGLSADTTYYARAYATNTAGTAYGDEVEFRTPDSSAKLPTVKTEPISSITATTAKGNGNITDLGYPEPIHHGIVWSREHKPSVSSSTKTDSGSASSTGSFSGLMTSLTPGTTYYVRAYAINTVGIAYGEEVETETLFVPGDIDGNGTIDLKDAILTLKMLAGDNQDSVDIRADIDGNEKIDFADAVYVLQYLIEIRE